MDHRIAAVEDNLDAFFERLRRHELLTDTSTDDVLSVHCDIAFPTFNSVGAARFGADAERRTREVANEFIDRGLPWLWWLTPSGTAPGMAEVLAELGLHHEPIPGMYRALPEAPAAPLPDGLTLELVDGSAEAFMDTMLAGFGMPEIVRAPMSRLGEVFAPGEFLNVLAQLDGVPVACGSGFVHDDVLGAYNIATLEAARGRGIGYAVTAALLTEGHRRGCRHAVLHASEAGLPVYERLGFETVCDVPQYVWLPSEVSPGEAQPQPQP